MDKKSENFDTDHSEYPSDDTVKRSDVVDKVVTESVETDEI